MRIIAFITEAAVVRDILIHLGEPIAPPTIAPARGHPRPTRPGLRLQSAPRLATGQPSVPQSRRPARRLRARRQEVVSSTRTVKVSPSTQAPSVHVIASYFEYSVPSSHGDESLRQRSVPPNFKARIAQCDRAASQQEPLFKTRSFRYCSVRRSLSDFNATDWPCAVSTRCR